MFHDHVQQAADYSSLDPYFLTGIVWALVALLGQKTAKFVAGRIAGNHLAIGKVAAEILRHLDQPGNWDIPAAAAPRGFILLPRGPNRSPVRIDTTSGAVVIGDTNISVDWNRLERRAVRVQARIVRAAIEAARHEAALAKAVRDLA